MCICYHFYRFLKNKSIIYHDGYSKLNGREMHVFRANKSFWNSLIIEEY